MNRAGWAGLYLAAASIGAHLGPTGIATQRTGIAAGLILWAWAVLRMDRARAGKAVGIAVAIWAILIVPETEIRLALLSGLLLCVPAPSRTAAAGFAAGALGWIVVRTGLPWLWILEVEFSRAASGLAGLLTGSRLDLGPAASGLDLLLLWLLAIVSMAGPRRRWPWRRVAAGAGVWVAYAACLPRLAEAARWLAQAPSGLLNFANVHPEPGSGGAANLMFACLPSLCAAFMLLLPTSPACGPDPAAPASRRIPSIATLGVAGALSCLLLAASGPRSRRPGDVMILRTPTIDFSAPAQDRPGLRHAGMFGLLDRYLALAGHRVRVIDGPLSTGALRRASVIVVILPVAPPGAGERELIDSFLDDGGSLLIMGDHTDLLGTMNPLNQWTGRWGIRFRFDSAYPVRRHWAGCLYRPEGRPPVRTGIGTGASLEISGRARPLIVGRYALSDRGDRANVGPGAFLGNYSYDEGELVGDIVLAASARAGRGRVVVFGDTSSLQNLMLPIAFPYVAGLFDDLASSPRWPREPALALAGMAAALLGWAGLRGDGRATAALAAALIVAAAGGVPPARPASLDELPRASAVAHVDCAHMNGFSLELWRRDSIGGLLVNLQRNGFLPVLRREPFTLPLPGPAHLPVIVGPRIPFQEPEAGILRRHLDRGGDILVAAGEESRLEVSRLLEPSGLRIGTVPLGPVPIEADMTMSELESAMQEPQFRDAWPLISSNPSKVRPLYSASGYTLVAQARAGSGGAGRLLVVADPDFLTDSVLEDERSAWPGNVRLFSRLLAGPRR